eukprot:s10644_g2.t1
MKLHGEDPKGSVLAASVGSDKVLDALAVWAEVAARKVWASVLAASVGSDKVLDALAVWAEVAARKVWASFPFLSASNGLIPLYNSYLVSSLSVTVLQYLLPLAVSIR